MTSHNTSKATFEEWLNDPAGHPHGSSSDIVDHLRDAFEAGVASQQGTIHDLEVRIDYMDWASCGCLGSGEPPEDWEGWQVKP